MTEFFTQFHFLRPLWLLMLIPSLLITFRLWHQHHAHGSWQKVIAPELLQHLLHEKAQRPGRLPLVLLLSGWIAACFALAGPAWQKMPVPVSKSQQPLVVVVDLSYYMMAADLKPDCLTRTRYKLQDLFRIRKDGISAIVAYAGSAHNVVPLTDDSRTLSNLVKAMNPGIMPVQGNKPAEGIQLAKQLLKQGSNESGNILLMTGNLSADQAARIHDLLENTEIRLSVLGTGTEQGAPIPLPDGGYLKNQQGTIVIPRLNRSELQELALDNGGQYHDITVNDSDLEALLPKASLNDEVMVVERDFDQWHDAGYWLLLLILPLALAGFRKGWLMAALFCILLPAAEETQAFGWKDLWSTADQQGQQALQNKDPEAAARLFNHSQWQGEALFQNGNFEEAAQAFAREDTPASQYNRGNALAKAGKLQEALDAYDRTLEQQPDFADAKANRKLVQDLLKQQQEQQSKDQQNKDQQNKDQQNKDQQNKDQQNKDQQNKDQQDKDQQNKDQQNKDQQNKDQQNKDQQNKDPQNKDQQNSDQQAQPDKDSQSSQEQQSEEQQSENKQPQGQGKNQQQDSEEQQQSAEQREPQKSEAERKEPQAQQPEAQKESDDEQQAEQQARVEQDDSARSPEKQAVESWLRTIPDDPGGLLRRKFQQQQQQRQGGN